MQPYDLIIIGSGPGGYIAANRANQLGLRTAIVEREKLGGVCLNKGCIPTKALLKAAQMAQETKVLKKFGIDVTVNSLNPEVAVKRAKSVTSRMSKGVSFLMKKNNVDVLNGNAQILSESSLKVGSDEYSFKNLIIATGARPREIETLKVSGNRVVNAWQALDLENIPDNIAIVGAGAIGMEMAYFWRAFGKNVTLFEMKDHLLPLEDDDVSVEIERSFKKLGIKFDLGVKSVVLSEKENSVDFYIENKKDEKIELNFDMALVAVGMQANIEGLCLEKAKVEVDRGFIKVDKFGKTSTENIFAIGDVSGPPLLAHVASHQAVTAVEKIAGVETHATDFSGVVACTYTHPEVASIGLRERELKEKGIFYKVGKVSFLANGKACATDSKYGFVKILLGEMDELLGAHLVGEHVTELIHELALFKAMEGVAQELIQTVHPHPTLGEWVHEAFLQAMEMPLNS